MAKAILITCTILMAILLMFASYDLALATGHYNKGHSKGKVHVNVWRGPTKGYKKYKFAPWGFYAKLPADEGKKKYHHYG